MAFLGTLLSIIALICAVWVIVDILTENKRLSTGTKVLWIVLALVFSIVTAIVYYFMYKNNK